MPTFAPHLGMPPGIPVFILSFTYYFQLDFSDFGLHPDLLEGVEAMNYKTATPIQAQAIPLILEGRDLIGTAQTGTGKTAAFVLPLLNLILESGESNITQALIIVPTRELAVQIEKMVSAYGYFAGISCLAVYGGGDAKSFGQEKSAITGGADIIVATPGRLIAHMNLGYVDFSRLRHLVLDEADRMLDMGFKPDLMKIIGKLSTQRQTMLFSATMPPEVMRFAKGLLRNPAQISISLSKPAEGVTQGAYWLDERQKIPLVVELLRDRLEQRTIVFGSSKKSVQALFLALKTKGLPVAQISSDLEQEDRERVMLAFRNSQIPILVATDVLSRGIDVDGIDLVLNFDVPGQAEDYVHRVGRTARAARTGTALTLVSFHDQHRFKRIEKLIGKEVPKLDLPPHIAKLKLNDVPDPRRSDRDRRGGKKEKSASTGQHKTAQHPAGAAESNQKNKRKPGQPNREQPENVAARPQGTEAQSAQNAQNVAKKRKKRRNKGKNKPQSANTPQPGPPTA